MRVVPCLALLCAGLLFLLPSPALSQTALSPELSSPPFRIGVITPPGHGLTEAAERIAEGLALGDQREVQVHASGRLGNERAMRNQLVNGELEAALLTISELTADVPTLQVLQAPFLVPDLPTAQRLINTPTSTALWAEVEATLDLKVLGVGLLGMRHMVFRHPIDTPANLEGISVRSPPNPAMVSFYQALGATVLQIPLPAVRDALARGMLDGADMDLELILTLRYADVSDQLAVTGHMIFPVVGLVSRPAWVSLSPEERSALGHAMERQLAALTEAYTAQEAQRLETIAAEGQMEITTPPPAAFSTAVLHWWESHGTLRPLAERLLRETKQAER